MSSRDVRQTPVRVLLQALLGAAVGAASSSLLLWQFPVDACSAHWWATPLVIVGLAVALTMSGVVIAGVRALFLACSLVMVGFASWSIFLGSAIGCD